MNIIITINGEDMAITKREAHVLYKQLNDALFWENKEANKEEVSKGAIKFDKINYNLIKGK